MNGVPAGAVIGARAAYDTHTPSNSQENQAPHKPNNTIDTARKRSTSSLRAPLSSLPAGRRGPNDHGQSQQHSSHNLAGDTEAPGAVVKIGHGLDGQENFYKRNASNGNLSYAESDDIPENMYRPEKEDLEGWIHREKLAKIENEELQAAGINLAKARSRSRDALGNRARTTSRDHLRNDFTVTGGDDKEDKRRKVSSPTPAQPEEQDETSDTQHWDLRTPEEIAADLAAQNYTTPVLRKSGSKIPVLSSSPNSVTADTTLPRKRTISGTLSSDEGSTSNKLRTSSSKWNEEDEPPVQGNSGKSNSPSKTRQMSISGTVGASSAAKTTSTTRKPSVVSKNNPTSPNGRPRTRGNDMDRPKTATNPPEGDPPWLADMYKPDPRLPPDQQLIPTLAKKQRQMQWEENGMIPKTYDREFAALAVHENNDPALQQRQFQPQPQPQPQPETEVSVEKTEQSESWPLKPMASLPSPRDAGPKTPANNYPTPTGGYSTMPKVSSPPMSISSPQMGSSTNPGAPSSSAGPTLTASAAQQSVQRTQQRPTSEEDDEKVQKKGCCCIVM